jgi:PAS domain S-box-containing protein
VRPEQRVAGLEELRRGRRVREVEADFRTKNGRIFTCLMSAELIQADGQLCVLTALTDITARKQADALLERYHLLSRRARDIVLFIRPDGQIVDANQAAMSAYGYDRATLLTMRIYDLRDSSPIPLVSEQMARANVSGLLFEAIHRRSDGSTFPVEVSSIGADIGGQRLLLSIIRDISERRRAEEEARVLADLTELIRLTEDPDELLWQASRALGEYLNVRRCFFIDIDVPNNYAVAHRQYCRDVPPVPSEYQVSDYSEQARSEIAAGRTIINCDSQIDPRTAASYERTYRPYGERAYVAVPLLREGRWEAMLWVSTDEPREWRPREVALLESVAERAWMAVEKLRLYAAEQRARALAEAAVRARDQFLQVASHELKTPLTALLGNAQLFERRTSRDGTLSERDRRAVRTIADQAARLDQMISALLDITRFDAGQVTLNRERIDLAALLRRVIDDLRPALMRHAIDLTGVASLPVEGDPMRLEQVFRNLLSNAVKYSPAGGRVSVRLDARDSSATVEVADEGVGIPPDALPHLFDRFFRVDSAATQRIDGTGLGLYVVREIVALHGGDVTATSEVGVGSVFTVSLPLKSRML